MAATLDYYLALSSPWTYLAGPRFAALVERSETQFRHRLLPVRLIGFRHGAYHALPSRASREAWP